MKLNASTIAWIVAAAIILVIMWLIPGIPPPP